ncbi:MAG: Rnase Y domain-containing protein, partial [Humidesulfovibrio sp.]|nr:Rnase Y domain-containing protein [Humidesulfovibrio sp.]
MNDTSLLLIAMDAMALIVGLVGGYYLSTYVSKKRHQDAQHLATRIVEEARKEAEATRKEARLQTKDEIFALKKEQDLEFKDTEQTLKREQARLQEKEERLEGKLEKVAQKESDVVELEKRLIKQEKTLAEKVEALEAAADAHERKLQEISGLTVEEAKERLMAEVESRTRHEAARMVRNIESEAKETAGKKAKEILSLAIQRYAGDYIADQTVTAVTLPSEEMKGRIIGREGRNIRALEAATGVDLIIDDTPETVILSAYSPLRREVA